MKLSDSQAEEFREAILKWFSLNRREFTWRDENVHPLRILVSEMLLRKTPAESAERILADLFERYPSLEDLAGADPEEVEEIIRSLGLQRIRSKALVNIAGILTREHGGRVPRDLDALTALPHVGRYGANATLVFAFGEPRPIVDANVVRVFNRVFGTERPVEVHRADELWELAAQLVPGDQPRAFNWGILDLAASVCTPRYPDCEACPLSGMCQAYQSGEIETGD